MIATFARARALYPPSKLHHPLIYIFKFSVSVSGCERGLAFIEIDGANFYFGSDQNMIFNSIHNWTIQFFVLCFIAQFNVGNEAIGTSVIFEYICSWLCVDYWSYWIGTVMVYEKLLGCFDNLLELLHMSFSKYPLKKYVNC